MATFGTTSATANPNPNRSTEVSQPPSDSVSSLCFSPKANVLVATSWDNQVRCWEIIKTGTSVSTVPKASISHEQPVLCSTWKDDGTTVFSGGCDKQVKMWPLLSGGQPVTVAMHDAPVKEIAWVPEMSLLVTGSWDKTLRWWLKIGSAFFDELVGRIDTIGALDDSEFNGGGAMPWVPLEVAELWILEFCTNRKFGAQIRWNFFDSWPPYPLSIGLELDVGWSNLVD
ncbi:RAE1 [Olea europaea subsp. europaea]|uniref:RAE1 n=1 Tax=Olea europaea subsp. europaea TaxID=158383 RepID=A0A8S0QF12_OLEEU|nr:RAE1 [Olea europaea subsp. europaea]